MTTLLLLAAAGIFAALAFRILKATSRVVDADEHAAAIEYFFTLPRDSGRSFLEAFRDGNTIAMTRNFPDWPRFRDRFMAVEKDLKA